MDHNGNNYNVIRVNGTGTINPAALTVQANNQTRTYDGTTTNNTNGVSYNGLVNGEAASVLGGTLALGGNALLAKDAGNYSIIASGLTSSNYAISYTDGSLRVEPASLLVQLNDASKAPGTVDPALSYQLSSGTLYGTDRFTGMPLRGAGEAIGNYAIDQGNITAGSNYRI